MNSPVDISVMNENEVEDTMDAILSIDTTKGNQVCNHKGFAITPTVKEGYILKLVMIYCTYIHNLLAFLQLSCQSRCKTLHPMVMVYSISIVFYNQQLQISSPVVGVITTESVVAGCATGATHVTDVENVVRFVLEVAKTYGANKCSFFDETQFYI